MDKVDYKTYLLEFRPECELHRDETVKHLRYLVFCRVVKRFSPHNVQGHDTLEVVLEHSMTYCDFSDVVHHKMCPYCKIYRLL